MSSAEDDEIEKSSAPLMEHLIELRTRLIWSLGGFFVAFLVCFFFAKQLFNLLVQPFQWASGWAGLDPTKVNLIYTAPQEFFFTQIKLGMFGGLVIAFRSSPRRSTSSWRRGSTATSAWRSCRSSSPRRCCS